MSKAGADINIKKKNPISPANQAVLINISQSETITDGINIITDDIILIKAYLISFFLILSKNNFMYQLAHNIVINGTINKNTIYGISVI